MDLSDFDRPLSSRGRNDAPEMGRRLAKKGLRPSRIISSPAVRTRATANAFADALHFPQAKIIWDPKIYEASRDTLLSILRKQPDRANTLILVGHNPGMTQLANALTQDTMDNLPTAGIYTLTLPINHWNDTQFGMGVRIALDTPKNAPHQD